MVGVTRPIKYAHKGELDTHTLRERERERERVYVKDGVSIECVCV